MKSLSSKTLKRFGIVIAAACFVGGIIVGMVFKREDFNAQGVLVQVFDIWAMLSMWLLGGVASLIFFGKSLGRK
jgi:hypothetical protein